MRKKDTWEEIEGLILEMTGNFAGAVGAFTKGTYKENTGVEMIIDFSNKSRKLLNLISEAKAINK